MLTKEIQNRIITGEHRTIFLIPNSIDDNRQKTEEDIIELEQKWVVDCLSLPASHGAIPPHREDHNEVLVEVVQYQVGISSVVFFSVVK